MRTRSGLHTENWLALLQRTVVWVKGNGPIEKLANIALFDGYIPTGTGKRGHDEEGDDYVVKRVRFNGDTSADKPAGANVTAHGVDATDKAKDVAQAASKKTVTKGMSSDFRSPIHNHITYALSDKAPRQYKRLPARATSKTVSVRKDIATTDATSNKSQEPATKAAPVTIKAIATKHTKDVRCAEPDCPFVAQKPSGLIAHRSVQYVDSIYFSRQVADGVLSFTARVTS